MTSTDKKVTRVTTKEYPLKTGLTGRGWGKARKIAITILPGDILVLRPSGTQQREYATIEDVYRWAQMRRLRSEMAQKINAKRRGKK